MRVVVTGANGYIGTRLVRLGMRCGHEMLAATRRPPGEPGIPWIEFDLSVHSGLRLTNEVDAFIHLAADTLPKARIDEGSEVAAAKEIIRATQAARVKFIFVSSQAARRDAPTAYGKTKWRIEQEVLAVGGWVVRPGQVYGGKLRGLYGTLVSVVQKLPLLPAFLPAPLIQPIHVDDLAECLLRIVERGDAKSGVYCLGSPLPISFSAFLAEIAKTRLRCRRVFIPFHVIFIKIFVAFSGEAWRTRFGLDRLHSLFNLRVMETASDISQLGVTLRPLSAGMHPSGSDRRRRLLREGKALLAYVLKEQPGNGLLRIYVGAVEGSRGGRVFGLPEFFLSYPILLSLLDKGAWPDATLESEFAWRMDAATMLAEATPTGAVRFLGAGQRHGPFISIFLIANAVLGEAFWRLVRVFVLPMLRYSLAGKRRRLER
jgi:nucleoside-diphosphate-sugar epimerase